MTATITRLTMLTVGSSTYDTLSTTFGVIAIVLLIALLIQKELMRVLGGTHAKTWQHTLDTMIAPLVFVFSVIVILRLVDLISVG